AGFGVAVAGAGVGVLADWAGAMVKARVASLASDCSVPVPASQIWESLSKEIVAVPLALALKLMSKTFFPLPVTPAEVLPRDRRINPLEAAMLPREVSKALSF